MFIIIIASSLNYGKNMEITNEDIKKVKEESIEVLSKNRRKTDGHSYTVPSPGPYPYQWFWDSCFHAIALSHFEPSFAKEELLSLVSSQFRSGLIPHMIYWEKKDVINIDWGREGVSTITQPPFIAYSVWKIYEKDRDKEFLSKIYPNLYHYYNFLLNERDPRHNHLAGIINPEESGEDNSPRFDGLLGLSPRHTQKENFKKRLELNEKNKTCNFDAPFCMREFFWVKDIPFNSILILSLGALGAIAEELDLKDDATYFYKQQLEVTDSMRDRLLEHDIFWSAEGRSYEKIKVKTWAMFAPLLAKVPTQEEADFVVRNYLLNEKEFKTKYMVPTVSQSEPGYVLENYSPEANWRGPVWMASNWIVYQGLLNYGFDKIADEVRKSSVALLKKSGFREYFHPETGEGMGAKDFTWGSLILDMYPEI
jgi:glycogen debranching enzyme